MQVGLQIYSVRNSFREDPLGTIERLAEIGYRHVEFFSHNSSETVGVSADVDVAALRQKLDEVGIASFGSHLDPMDTPLLDEFLDLHVALGSKTLTSSIDFWTDGDHVRRRCDVYNEVGRRCRERGLQFLIHNHFHEFQEFDGVRVLDIIFNNTDPDVVGLEMDTYWTLRGTVDPIQKLAEYGSRVRAIHQKDYPLSEIRRLDVWAHVDPNDPLTQASFESAVQPTEFTEIGDGIMKIQEIINAANAAGVELLLVEQDHSAHLTEFERVTRSFNNLRAMTGLDWQSPVSVGQN